MQTKVSKSRKIVRTSAKTKTVRDEESKSLGVFLPPKTCSRKNGILTMGAHRNRCFLTDLHPSSQDGVIFGDGEKGRVMGSGFLKIPG